jgi:hypothetical protein
MRRTAAANGRGRARLDPKFFKDMAEVLLNRATADPEDGSDFAIAFSFADPLHHLALAGREAQRRQMHEVERDNGRGWRTGGCRSLLSEAVSLWRGGMKTNHRLQRRNADGRDLTKSPKRFAADISLSPCGIRGTGWTKALALHFTTFYGKGGMKFCESKLLPATWERERGLTLLRNRFLTGQ